MSMNLASHATNAVLFAYARRALAAGRRDGATAVAHAAARAWPDGCALQLAELLSEAGCTAEARTVLAPLAARDPDAVSAALANVALREGRLEEAVVLLRSHLATYPDTVSCIIRWPVCCHIWASSKRPTAIPRAARCSPGATWNFTSS